MDLAFLWNYVLEFLIFWFILLTVLTDNLASNFAINPNELLLSSKGVSVYVIETYLITGYSKNCLSYLLAEYAKFAGFAGHFQISLDKCCSQIQ